MITEKQLESQVKDLAKIFGWKWYHTFLSKWSDKGFPDLVLVRPPRLIFAELKGEAGKVSPEQQEWLDLLWDESFCTGIPEVYLWRPDDIEKIAEVLR